MREEIIEDINRALDAGAHLSALALAIAIPDFCGKYYIRKYKIENPQNPKGYSQSRFQYTEWYKKYFLMDTNEKKHNSDCKSKFSKMDSLNLSPEQCYALRCSFLHEMTENINEQPVMNGQEPTDVILYRGNVSFFLYENGEHNQHVNPGIEILIHQMIFAYKRFLSDNPEFEIELQNF